MDGVYDSFCRICTNLCSIKVEIADGAVVKISGNSDNPMYRGFSCIKGRSQPAYLTSPDRLLHSLKRTPYDRYEPIPVEKAMDEIAAKLRRILDEYGPRAIASYAGSGFAAKMSSAAYVYGALFKAIGTPFMLDPNTLDKGGKQIAEALHGRWMGRPQGFDRPEVALFIGANPMVACTGFPAGNPGQWLKDATRAGMKAIVLDPRKTELASRAYLHLQAAPGYDAEILAAIIRIIIEEQLFDDAFIADNVDGLEALRATVAPFAAEFVAARAGVASEDIVRAARTFAAGKRGYVMAGTGPSMSANGSLVEYLVLCLETLCGHWLREGEQVVAAPALEVAPVFKAQAEPPRDWAMSEKMRVRGLTQSAAGIPCSAIADEILLEGPGQIRALISAGGNPAAAFPDQIKMARALRSLSLLVQIDPWMSQTASLAHYVIAPTMPLESPEVSVLMDYITKRAAGYGTAASHAQYTPALASPPPGSDVIEEWRFFLGVAQRMGFDIRLPDSSGEGTLIDSGLDTDDLIEKLFVGTRIPLATVKRHAAGAFFPDPPLFVQPKEAGWEGRLDIGNANMMRDLALRSSANARAVRDEERFPFRLLCRRERHVYNSSCNVAANNRGRGYNPAFIHPLDLEALGLRSGDSVWIESDLAGIPAIVESDETLRQGMVSIAFGFGGHPNLDDQFAQIGSSTNRLVRDDGVFDAYTGQPQMSNIPVRISKLNMADVKSTRYRPSGL
jgi:anaerobic selenocysteine-containing dehydrogenase